MTLLAGLSPLSVTPSLCGFIMKRQVFVHETIWQNPAKPAPAVASVAWRSD
ncbi:Hypothetical protein RAK1035_1754 [Roseovarius sp. AK1035]|nr:Hypothetical protein RAK1035_1754 [Roseovarius sp. AK1035]